MNALSLLEVITPEAIAFATVAWSSSRIYFAEPHPRRSNELPNFFHFATSPPYNTLLFRLSWSRPAYLPCQFFDDIGINSLLRIIFRQCNLDQNNLYTASKSWYITVPYQSTPWKCLRCVPCIAKVGRAAEHSLVWAITSAVYRMTER